MAFGRRIRRYHVSGVQTCPQSVHRFMCWNSAPARSLPRFPHSGQLCPAIHQSMIHPASAVIVSVSGASRTRRARGTGGTAFVEVSMWLVSFLCLRSGDLRRSLHLDVRQIFVDGLTACGQLGVPCLGVVQVDPRKGICLLYTSDAADEAYDV